MSRPEAGPGVMPMSAGASAMLALSAPWRGRIVCSGCGQSPEYLAPFDAVTAIRALARRCTTLLHHHEGLLAHRRGQPGSWSAMEPAAQVSAVLGAVNDRLRKLLDEEIAEPVPIAIEGAELAPDNQQRAPASLVDNVRSLVATIRGATTQDWHRARPGDDATAAEMVWLALHDARHHLEDAELILDGTLAGGPAAWAPADAEVHFRRD